MKHKDIIIMSCLVLSIIFLGTGTFAYFRFGSTGNITINAGELMLSINDKSATQNEEFEVTLTNSDGSNLKPGDSGSFNLTLNATGSSLDVSIVLEIIRTNLPGNLKFYVDEEHTREFSKQKYDIVKASSMTKVVTIYWYWEDLEESNDNDFMFKEITATINGTISYYYELPKIYDTLLASAHNNLDTNVDFGAGSSSTNGIGLMMRDGTQNDEYPIVYYRGNVNNNNVIYADKCWLIVRTTETGGVKLIYNGEVNSDGSCTNYSNVTVEGVNSGGFPLASASATPGTYDSNYINAYINKETYAFNTNYDSPVYVGYMYNDTNKYFTGSGSSGTLDGAGYIAHLSDNTIDSTTGRHAQNLKDSTIKGVIDAWYASNIDGKPEENLLEDTVWCADRSITSANFPIENYTTNSIFTYSAVTRLGLESVVNPEITSTIAPSLACNRDIDKFTVDSANGNGDLTHPVGMLTADEILMAGNTLYPGSKVITYLSIPTHFFWALSPDGFYGGYAGALGVDIGVLVSYGAGLSDSGVRPSVSLGFGAYVTSGNGTFETPYKVG